MPANQSAQPSLHVIRPNGWDTRVGNVMRNGLPSTGRRLSTEQREKQIVAAAISFFAERGFDGQLRDLAKNIGVTHTLLYHYFPTKQALIERVFSELVQNRWKPEWDVLIDSRSMAVPDKFLAFYSDYLETVLTYEFTRIVIYSGLNSAANERFFLERFFEMLRERLFPRLIRETRRHHKINTRAKPTSREIELLVGLHGGIFYFALRRFVYGQKLHDAQSATADIGYLRDRISAYLISWKDVIHGIKT